MIPWFASVLVANILPDLSGSGIAQDQEGRMSTSWQLNNRSRSVTWYNRSDVWTQKQTWSIIKNNKGYSNRLLGSTVAQLIPMLGQNVTKKGTFFVNYFTFLLGDSPQLKGSSKVLPLVLVTTFLLSWLISLVFCIFCFSIVFWRLLKGRAENCVGCDTH